MICMMLYFCSLAWNKSVKSIPSYLTECHCLCFYFQVGSNERKSKFALLGIIPYALFLEGTYQGEVKNIILKIDSKKNLNYSLLLAWWSRYKGKARGRIQFTSLNYSEQPLKSWPWDQSSSKESRQILGTAHKGLWRPNLAPLLCCCPS